MNKQGSKTSPYPFWKQVCEKTRLRHKKYLKKTRLRPNSSMKDESVYEPRGVVITHIVVSDNRLVFVVLGSNWSFIFVGDFDGMPSPPTRRNYIIVDLLQSVGSCSISIHSRFFAQIVLDTRFMYATRTIQLSGCKYLRIGDLVEITRLSQEREPQ